MLNLDTHVLIHALEGRLTAREREVLSSDAWGICGIVLWEIAKLVQLGRIDMDLDDSAVVRALSRIHTWPLTLEVCRAISDLDFEADPADELIAATSVVHQVPLVTRDGTILGSRVVPLAERARGE
jgi:PIN domain nuclease of toxin-antitoxin system